MSTPENKPPAVMLPVAGVSLAAISCGIKKNASTDLVLISFDESASCAATFTQNAFCAAPVTLAKKHMSQSPARALLINSGNANAGTGETGLQNAEQSCVWLAQKLSCSAEQILPFSTGVIGQQLPMDKMQSGISSISDGLSEDNWSVAAEGIKTTDTVAKTISRSLVLNGKAVTINGIAKGSGMICPNMATMLSFIATDANIESSFLQQCLSEAVTDSFNAITVDGDTSTNDACVLIASGKAGNEPLMAESEDVSIFIEALNEVCQHLAHAIIRDAEGATKFVTISVKQAQSKAEARDVAYTVAHSPLVKTALFASDANWGRILAAVGRANIENLDINGVNLYLDDVCIVSNGGVDSAYTEEQGAAVMVQKDITITIELSRGDEAVDIWTSDLSHEYVRINAEYRT